MRTVVLFLSLCLLAASQQYSLVWQDEFDGNSLDLSKWQYEINCDGGGNNELQCYTNSPNNVAVRNGNLVVTATPQNLNGKQYTSGRINTAGKAAWKYGRFDIRAKLPNGPYLWPALWMMPRDAVYGWWAASGEIDIMEARGQFPSRTESTLHHGGSWPNNIYTGSGPRDMGVDLSADFHIYTCIWTSSQIQFQVDGNTYYTLSLDRSWWSGIGSNPYTANGQPFDQYFYFIINLAVGGGFFGADANSLTVQQAQQWASPSLLVDYVRVYQLTNNPVTPPAPVPVPVPTSSSTFTPANTAQSGNGGCNPGACGSASCCNDQNNGQLCYSPSQYTCSVDGFSGKYGLCGAGSYVCRGACYNPQLYSCVNGWLQQGAQQQQQTPATSSTKAATSSSTTKAATSSSTTKAATSSSTTKASTVAATTSAAASGSGASCPNGCGPNSCCNGGCYSSSMYSCQADPLGSFQICQNGMKACATACYNPATYKCGSKGLELVY